MPPPLAIHTSNPVGTKLGTMFRYFPNMPTVYPPFSDRYFAKVLLFTFVSSTCMQAGACVVFIL